MFKSKKNKIHKRDLDKIRNHHMIFKRNALDDLKNSSSIRDVIDYQISDNIVLKTVEKKYAIFNINNIILKTKCCI